MLYEEIRLKQGFSYVTFVHKDSLQQQIYFNGHIFENKWWFTASAYLQTPPPLHTHTLFCYVVKIVTFTFLPQLSQLQQCLQEHGHHLYVTGHCNLKPIPTALDKTFFYQPKSVDIFFNNENWLIDWVGV